LVNPFQAWDAPKLLSIVDRDSLESVQHHQTDIEERRHLLLSDGEAETVAARCALTQRNTLLKETARCFGRGRRRWAIVRQIRVEQAATRAPAQQYRSDDHSTHEGSISEVVHPVMPVMPIMSHLVAPSGNGLKVEG
jgi:hypothetical protein